MASWEGYAAGTSALPFNSTGLTSQRSAAAAMVARMAEGAQARAWGSWRDYVADRGQHREQLQAALQHWTARELASAFNQFRCCPLPTPVQDSMQLWQGMKALACVAVCSALQSIVNAYVRACVRARVRARVH